MLVGMIVVHEGTPKVVRNISGTTPGFSSLTPGHTVYELQPKDGARLEYAHDPLAVEVPLLPACPEHGTPEPGRYGSVGWVCHPWCEVTWNQRAALLETPA